MTPEGEKALRGTVGNLMTVVAEQSENIRLLIGVVGELRDRVEALETARSKKPALVNAQGERLN